MKVIELPTHSLYPSKSVTLYPRDSVDVTGPMHDGQQEAHSSGPVAVVNATWTGTAWVVYGTTEGGAQQQLQTGPPTITLNGAATVSVALNGTYSDLGATASNGATVTASSNVDVAQAGTYMVTYSAAGAAGATRTVQVA
jgi:hypothetical protein